MAFPTFNIQGIVTINPSFEVVANAVGFVQLQPGLDVTVDFEYSFNNLQFTYPSNTPPATVSVSSPSQHFFASMQPSENSNAQFGIDTVLELLVQISAFSQFVELTVTHDVANSVELQATPAATGNNEDVCLEIINTYTIQVANGGPFFQAFGSANSQIIFESGTTVKDICQVIALGPSPPNIRLGRSSRRKRDSFSCPAPAAIPITTAALSG